MGTLDDQIQEKYQDIEGNAAAVDKALGADQRAVPDMPSVDGQFQNGRDLNVPPGSSPVINATASPGGVTVAADHTIELLHFGFAYLDRASLFDHAALDDTDPQLDLGALRGCRAVQYRAALEREAIVIAGFVGAHMTALGEREQDEGSIGKALGIVGNLLGGGGGSSSTALAADLNPFVTQLATIGGQLDVATMTYDVTHQAGIDLHKVRSSYAAYLKGESDKYQKGPAPDTGLLGGIPVLASVLPKEIGHIFTLVEKMATKAFDIYVALLVELQRAWGPVIEQACRDASIDAITARRAPAFDVWLPPHQQTPAPSHLIDAPTVPPALGPLAGLVSNALSPVTGAIGDVNSVADPVVDFLSRPGAPAPGGPFLDQVFAQTADGAGYLTAAAGVTSLGDVAVAAVTTAFGFPMPAFVQTIIKDVCGVHADFLRGVYGKLVGMDPTKPISDKDMIEAGRSHLQSQIVEALAHGVGLLDKLRAFKFDLDLFGPIAKTLSGEALFQRAKELLDEELGKHLDPILAFAMKHFADTLEAVRQEAGAAITMEVYLARLPYLYAWLFRKTFFPIWDLIVDTVFTPVRDLLNPMAGDAKALAQKAQGIVNTVRTELLRATNLAHTALTQGLTGGLGGTNLGAYQQALDSVLPGGGAPAGPAIAIAKTFPVPGRKTSCAGTPIDGTMLQNVAPHDQWQVAPSSAASPAAASPAAAPPSTTP